MTPRILCATLIAFLLLAPTVGTAGDQYAPEDPFASISGEPVYLGELNLVLHQRLRIKDLAQTPPAVQQATALMLVRQHLACAALQERGGATIQAMIDRGIESFTRDLKRRGTSLAEHAKSNHSNEAGVLDQLRWQVVWREYLKSRLTEKNLKLFYSRNADKYAGGRWEVSHIFLPVDPKVDFSADIADDRIEQILEQLKESSDVVSEFASAAKTNSEGGTAREGGYVGWVSQRGDLPAALMNAVRETKPGTVSDRIVSPLGRHLILVHDFEVNEVPFEALPDQAALRRDATDALFEVLVSSQSDKKVQWLIRALKPPTAPSG